MTYTVSSGTLNLTQPLATLPDNCHRNIILSSCNNVKTCSKFLKMSSGNLLQICLAGFVDTLLYLVPKVTCYVSSETLNPRHSLTFYKFKYSCTPAILSMVTVFPRNLVFPQNYCRLRQSLAVSEG